MIPFEEFVAHVNRNNISLSSQIPQSMYETNEYLIENHPNLIEYAVFNGSIQIFQYLKFNNVDLKSSLWLYAIHSKNAEIIHLLEEYNVHPEDESFIKVYTEAIKCHHNDIANYIEGNLLNVNKNDKNCNFTEEVSDCCFDYSNYLFLPDDYNQSYVFFSLCKNNYSNIVNLILKNKKDEIESTIVF